LFAVWRGTGDSWVQLRAIEISSDGTPTRDFWTPEGELLCGDVNAEQVTPSVSILNNRKALVVWNDGRSSTQYDVAYNLYAQLVELEISSGAGDNPGAQLPASFALHQNYPNPFNPSTTIEFSLAKAVDTKLTVYDILGREVATRLNEPLTAGLHSVPFDAAALPSGVYFYRLDAGAFHDAKKMVVLK
jgi:hypothetical protein